MIRHIVGYVLGFLVGIFPGFFLVFNAIFTDGPDAERAFAFVLIFIAYLVIGFIFGLLFYGTGAWVSLTIPSSIIVILYSLRENENVILHLLAFSVPIASALIGSVLGSYLKKRRNRGKNDK
ncbi:MAG: hypothetical protein KAH57_04210 [Thermoplasmata archaeon]|nr:hypothetical protein [Thermoplasmata archaeon]